MPSSPSDGSWRALAWAAALGALLLAGGCIADTAEDSDLPWATNQGWEGMIPIPAGAANQYD
jgi:hypothetical protein